MDMSLVNCILARLALPVAEAARKKGVAQQQDWSMLGAYLTNRHRCEH